MPDLIPLFATAARLPRDPADCTFKTLGEVFDSLLYQVGNGEDIRHELMSLAKLTANDAVPMSIREDGESAGEGS